jgi:N utilization substance protein B
MKRAPATSRRGRARELLAQALYQAQITGQEHAELAGQFAERDEYARVDRDWFREILKGALAHRTEHEADIAEFADRPFDQLDPVEIAVLLVGLEELRHHPEVPFRVVINEAVSVARRYGAEEGHRYVNAILDAAAARYRQPEKAVARR